MWAAEAAAAAGGGGLDAGADDVESRGGGLDGVDVWELPAAVVDAGGCSAPLNLTANNTRTQCSTKAEVGRRPLPQRVAQNYWTFPTV